MNVIEPEVIGSDDARPGAILVMIWAAIHAYQRWDEAERNAALRATVHPSMGERWRSMRGST